MGPLAGVRIVELAGIGPAPFCGMLLADLGADVVLVDRKGGALPFDAQPRYDITRRGKRSIAVDLKQPGAADLVLRLVESADGLIEGFRPGVTERLGLGPDVCLARNPRLVYGRLTGWGQSGPLAQSAGHDINYVALSGLLYHGGHRGSPPSIPPTVVGDIGGGAMFMALGLVSAILRARETGQGQVIDGAITDGCAVMSALIQGLRAQRLWVDRRQSNVLDGGAHWYDCYECADGEWISVGALEPQFYRLLLEKCGLSSEGLEDAQFDFAHWPRLKERLAGVFRGKTRAEWCELLEGHGCLLRTGAESRRSPSPPAQCGAPGLCRCGGCASAGTRAQVQCDAGRGAHSTRRNRRALCRAAARGGLRRRGDWSTGDRRHRVADPPLGAPSASPTKSPGHGLIVYPLPVMHAENAWLDAASADWLAVVDCCCACS